MNSKDARSLRVLVWLCIFQCLEKQVGIMLLSMYIEIFLQVPSDHRDELFDEIIRRL